MVFRMPIHRSSVTKYLLFWRRTVRDLQEPTILWDLWQVSIRHIRTGRSLLQSQLLQATAAVSTIHCLSTTRQVTISVPHTIPTPYPGATQHVSPGGTRSKMTLYPVSLSGPDLTTSASRHRGTERIKEVSAVINWQYRTPLTLV